jgi:hypothetical protein
MAVAEVKEIEKQAPRRHSDGRKEYYEELEKKCPSPRAYKAILITILECQELIRYSKVQGDTLRTTKHDAKAEYESYTKERNRLRKSLGVVDGIRLKLEPAEWPRDHMAVGRGSVEISVNERDEMVGVRVKEETPKGGRPKNVYVHIVLLMLDSKLREYRIKPHYQTIAEISYYFFDVRQKRDSSYDADTVKRIIMRLKHNKALVARVEAAFRKAREIQPGPHRLRAPFPREDSISF